MELNQLYHQNCNILPKMFLKKRSASNSITDKQSAHWPDLEKGRPTRNRFRSETTLLLHKVPRNFQSQRRLCCQWRRRVETSIPRNQYYRLHSVPQIQIQTDLRHYQSMFMIIWYNPIETEKLNKISRQAGIWWWPARSEAPWTVILINSRLHVIIVCYFIMCIKAMSVYVTRICPVQLGFMGST